MIDALKAKVWGLLREKEVSLAMVCDRSGAIVWHRGREVTGRTLDDGDGFSKSSIRQVIEAGAAVEASDVVVTASGAALPASARVLYLKSLVVQPIDDTFLLYVDSGSKSAFSAADVGAFKVLGELLRDCLATIKRSEREAGGITGSSAAMDGVRDLVLRYALEEAPVLLLGETGVGKSHIAELIHRYSGRRGRFVTAHAPSIPEALFESEMFGHARGAFTGASRRSAGLVEAAERGTLFLDEISEVPVSFQAKLLMLAERRAYRVLGETRERTADVRIVAASNRDLAAEVAAKRFRSDLYYRLAVLPIVVPPLRDRPGDVRDLVEQHLALLRGKAPGEEFWRALEHHSWPGNVRELLHVLQRAGIRAGGASVGSEIAEILAEDPAAGDAAHPATTGGGDAVARVEAAIRGGAPFWDSAWRAFLARDINRAELKEMLRRWHAEHGGSLRSLSEALHIDGRDYPRFIAALHKYRIHPDLA